MTKIRAKSRMESSRKTQKIIFRREAKRAKRRITITKTEARAKFEMEIEVAAALYEKKKNQVPIFQMSTFSF